MKLDHDGYPTTCAICGKPIVKSHGGSVHELTIATRTAQSWHIPCRYPKESTTVSDTTTEPETPTPLQPVPDPNQEQLPDEPEPDDNGDENGDEEE